MPDAPMDDSGGALAAGIDAPMDDSASPHAEAESDLLKLRLFYVDQTREAYLVHPFESSGKSTRPLRRDLADDVLPLVDWDASIVGQRARVLVGEHEWTEAVIASYKYRTYTLALADGSSMQQSLPDHRVILHVEATQDGTDAPPDLGANAAELGGDAAGEAVATCPAGHQLEPVAATGGVTCDGCGSAIGASDLCKTFACQTCDYDLCAACTGASTGGGARRTRVSSRNVDAALPYFSSLSPTGFRHVVRRAASTPGTSDTYEADFYLNGREKSLEACASAAAAAESYREFVASTVTGGGSAGGGGGGGGASSSSGAAAKGGATAKGGLAGKGGVGKGGLAVKGGSAKGAMAAIEYGAGLVGRRVRVLREESGEWVDGTLTSFARRYNKARYGVQLLCASGGGGGGGTNLEMGLPDDNVRLLPAHLGEGDPSPPLTKDEERQACRVQAALSEAAARAEIARDSLVLHTSSNIDTGYRCVHAVSLRCGAWQYEVKTETNGKKFSLGRYASKLEAAVVFARFVERTRGASGEGGHGFGNMLLKTAVPDSNEFGYINTIEKVLDMRDIEVEGDDEDDAFCAVCARDVTCDGNEIMLCDGAGCNGAYHQHCLAPPLLVVPEGDWLCPKCRAKEAGDEGGGGAAAAIGTPQQQPGRNGSGAAVLWPNNPSAPLPIAATSSSQRRHTKLTLAAIAAGLPYEAGVVRHTKDSLAALVQLPYDEMDEMGAEEEDAGEAVAPPIVRPSPHKEPVGAEDTPETAVAGESATAGGGEGAATSAETMGVEANSGVGEAAAGGGAAALETAEGGADEAAPRNLRLVRQYLVKLRGHSYVRCEWLSAAQIEADGKLSRNCLQRFLRKHVDGSEEIDQAYKEYVSLQRIVGHRLRAAGGASSTAPTQLEHLCKWSGLTYAECSWEPAGGAVTAEHLAAYEAMSNVADAAKAEEERRKKLGWLTISAPVEVMPGEGVYAGAWCSASTISLPHGGMLAVEYGHIHAVPGDDTSPMLRQKIELSRVRPLPPSSVPPSSAAAAGPPKGGAAARKAVSSPGSSPAKVLPKAWGEKAKPDVGDAVQMYYGRAWWRATVRAVRGTGELLDDLRDEVKLAADTKLLLQPVEDPTDRKRRPGERRLGRDGRLYELCELRSDGRAATAANEAASEGDGAEAQLDESSPMDDLQLGSIAAVREWRLVPPPPPLPEAVPTAEVPAAATRGDADGDGDGDGDEALASMMTTRAARGDANGAAAGTSAAAAVGEDAAAADGDAPDGDAPDGDDDEAAPRRKRPKRSSSKAKASKKQRLKAREQERAQTSATHLRGKPREELPGARVVVTYDEDQPLGASESRPNGGKELVGHWVEVYWEGDAIWYRAQVIKHHPMKGGGSKYCGTREQHSIYYPGECPLSAAHPFLFSRLSSPPTRSSSLIPSHPLPLLQRTT